MVCVKETERFIYPFCTKCKIQGSLTCILIRAFNRGIHMKITGDEKSVMKAAAVFTKFTKITAKFCSQL
jgi:hypothetical protein